MMKKAAHSFQPISVLRNRVPFSKLVSVKTSNGCPQHEVWNRNNQLKTISKVVFNFQGDKPTSTYNENEWYERSRSLESICFKRKGSSFFPALMEHYHSLALCSHFQLSEFRASRLWNEHAESDIQLVTFLARVKPHYKSALSRTVSFLGKK